MIAHANHHLVASLKFFSQAASLMVICVGCLVLSG